MSDAVFLVGVERVEIPVSFSTALDYYKGADACLGFLYNWPARSSPDEREDRESFDNKASEIIISHRVCVGAWLLLEIRHGIQGRLKDYHTLEWIFVCRRGNTINIL